MDVYYLVYKGSDTVYGDRGYTTEEIANTACTVESARTGSSLEVRWMKLVD